MLTLIVPRAASPGDETHSTETSAAPSSKTTLSIGRSSVFDFVFSVTLLTRRSRWFVLTPVTRASGHKPLGDFSSVSSTMSLI